MRGLDEKQTFIALKKALSRMSGSPLDERRVMHGFCRQLLEKAWARSQVEALEPAAAIGYPVVAKVVSPQIMHKSDVQGAVRGAITKNEPRLYNVSVSLGNIETGPNHPLGIAIKVIGNFKEDKEEKRFEETFNVG